MNIELLSPAGDFKGALVAINNGADAIYLGGKLLNARKGAENLSSDELREVCEYAHIFGKKVYLTVNTILENSNFTDLYNLVQGAISAGVDAYIIQDLGVLEFIREYFYGLELHASTQMAVHNLEGCIVAKNLGFSRVVLSRETPLSEIRRIKDNIDIELEYFIQGALCVSFSGNCYLSACLKGESGNKGRCLQLCRLPFIAYEKERVIKRGYLLSAKDINMSKRIKDLCDAGICSFKIEGRARRIGYNAIVTSEYRKILDKYKENTQNTCFIDDKTEFNLKLAFNRGDFVEGYLNGNGDIIYDKIQGHKGAFIGRIKKVIYGKRYNTVEILSEYDLNKGDSFKIIREDREICTIAPMDICTNGNMYKITTTADMREGDLIYKIVDVELENTLVKKVLKKPINMCLIARPEENMKLLVECDGINVECCGNKAMTAINQPATMQSVCENLSRLNDTEFVMSDFMAILNNVFIKKQDLNMLRSRAVLELKKQLISKYNEKFSNIKILKKYDSNAKNYKNNTYFCKNIKNFDKIIQFFEQIKNVKYFFNVGDYSSLVGKNIEVLNIYNILFESDIKLIKQILQNSSIQIVVVNNISHFEILKECNYHGNVVVGPLMNIANDYALNCIMKFKVDGVILSPETTDMDFEMIKKDFDIPIMRYGYCNLPLMSLVHCPIKNLFKNNCGKCRYCDDLVYELSGVKLNLFRVKLKNCFFNLYKKID